MRRGKEHAMDFSRLRSYPDRSPAESPWWWRLPRPNERDWFVTGLKALFVVGTLLGAFYLRAMALIPPTDLGVAITAENYERIREGMHEAELENLFGVGGGAGGRPRLASGARGGMGKVDGPDKP
jgi:hypothetical protein